MIFDSREAQGASAAALRREAAILERCRHPCVAGLSELIETPMGAVLRTARSEGSPLAAETGARLPTVIARLATAVADLHDLGVAHRKIAVEAVTVTCDGRPILGDFSAAISLSESAPSAVDAALRNDDRALGALVLDLIGDGPSPTPESESLLRLANAARNGRLTARAMASGVAPTESAPSAWDRCGSIRHRVADVRAAGGAALVAVAAVVAVVVLSSPRASRRVPLRPPSTAPLPTVTVPATTPIAAATSPPAATIPPCGSDFCGAMTYADGIVTIANRHFAVGSAGDVAIAGRWGCSVSPHLALLATATGAIWVYPKWPAPGTNVTPSLVGVVPGAARMWASDDGRCDDIDVQRSDGSVVSIDPPSPT